MTDWQPGDPLYPRPKRSWRLSMPMFEVLDQPSMLGGQLTRADFASWTFTDEPEDG